MTDSLQQGAASAAGSSRFKAGPIAVGVVMVLALAAVVALMRGGAAPEARVEITAPPVMLTSVAAMRVLDRIEATGQLIAKQEAQVAAQVNGEITAVEAHEGEAVEQGQVMLRIDPELRELAVAQASAEVAQARAEVEEAKREAARLENLRARNAVSQSQLDSALTAQRLATSRLEGAVARRRVAERALRDSEVEAPFAGFIARRHVSRGEFVSPGQPLVDLVALDPIEVEFHLAEVDSGRAKLGAPVEVRVAPFPDESFEARVSAVSPTIDTATRTLRVKADLANPDGRLRPGLFSRVDLGVAVREGVPMVPEEVVLQRADGAVVFRMAGANKVERVNVKTGIYRDGRVEIVEGLDAGDRVVIRGQADLINGSVVSVRNQDGTLVGQQDVAPDPAVNPGG